MAKRKTKSFPYFYAVLALLVIVGACFVAYGLNLLKSWMADYESTQPKYVAERVFNQVFANPDFDELLEKQGYTVCEAETKQDLINYVKAQVGDGKITYQQAASGVDGGTLKYVVSAGDNAFAQFTVVKTDAVTEYGNPIYMPGDYEIYYKTETKSVTIIAPSDAKVSINGYVLDGRYIIKTEETESCAHMPGKVLKNDDNTQGIKFSTYYFDGLLYDTDNIAVTDKYGDPCPMTKNKDGVFLADINYNEDYQNTHSENVLFFVEEYAKYAMRFGSFNKFKNTIDPDSDLYEKISTMEYYWVHKPDGYEFTSRETGEFYEYGENVFSCRVTVDWHAWRGNKTFNDTIDLTLYLRLVDGVYLIYDMQTHAVAEGTA